jgi:hypothetical protein
VRIRTDTHDKITGLNVTMDDTGIMQLLKTFDLPEKA